MRRGRFAEDQIIGVLREHEAGVKTAALCRKHGISNATFYNGKAKYGGTASVEFTNRPRQGHEDTEANLSAA